MVSATVLATALLMALATASARLLPFLLARRLASPRLRRLFVERFPPAVLAVLVVFLFRDAGEATAAELTAQALGVATTAAAHLLLRNLLVSVASGTGVHMAAAAFAG